MSVFRLYFIIIQQGSIGVSKLMRRTFDAAFGFILFPELADVAVCHMLTAHRVGEYKPGSGFDFFLKLRKKGNCSVSELGVSGDRLCGDYYKSGKCVTRKRFSITEIYGRNLRRFQIGQRFGFQRCLQVPDTAKKYHPCRGGIFTYA